MRQISFKSESGVILPIVIILMLALIITGIAFLNAGVMENRLAKREVYKNQAFYLAEGGLDRTLWNLKQDFVSGSEEWTGWTGNDINGVPVCKPLDGTWGRLVYGDYDFDPTSCDPDMLDPILYKIILADGSYEVKLEFVDEDELWVISTGIVNDISRTVRIRVKAVNISVWNNAIFAKKSAIGGNVIEGNARVYGSVLILGQEDAVSPVMDMSGTTGIRNNYEDIPDDLRIKLPPIVKIVNGDEIETLDAMFRVVEGYVSLQGDATVGEDIPNGSIKRTMDEVHVDGGFQGSGGIDNVYTDNEDPHSSCDIDVSFPSLLDPLIDEETGNVLEIHYLDYLTNVNNWNSLHVTMGPDLNQIPETGITSEFDRNISDEKGSIKWSWNEVDKKIELEIGGIVWIDTDLLHIGGKLTPIEYTGRGVIVVADYDNGDTKIKGEIQVHGDLLAKGVYNPSPDFPIELQDGFPINNALGLVTGTLSLAHPGEAQLMMTGAFFAENQIYSRYQNEIAGTFVTGHFDIGSQVPRIYQVPKLAIYVPEGMPGAPPNWVLMISEWSES